MVKLCVVRVSEKNERQLQETLFLNLPVRSYGLSLVSNRGSFFYAAIKSAPLPYHKVETFVSFVPQIPGESERAIKKTCETV